MGRIVYISWPAGEITGGIKMVFRHVEALVEEGFSAVVATRDGVVPQWFSTSASVIPISAIEDDDTIVFPENDAELLEEFQHSPHRKLVFCQNQFMAFRGIGQRRCYSDYGVTDILCPSYSVVHYCRRRFPDLKLGYVPYYVDHQVFQPQENKQFQIAFVPRKRHMEAAFVQDLFRAEHPEFRAVPWVCISGASEAEVASVLANSAVYLSLSRFESFGLTTLESLACGCIAVGFTGFGGDEYATSKNGYWAREDDCLECVDQLARAVRLVSDGGEIYSNAAREAIRTSRQYRRDTFLHYLAKFWRERAGG